MSTPRLISLPSLRAAAFGAMLVLAVSLSAGEGGFSATLSTEQKNSSGLSGLTSAERDILDRLVAAEVGRARREDSNELDGTFVARRTDAESKEAGLNRLTPAQLTKLNALVSAALAASPKPKERPRIRDADVFSAPKKPEVHGELSLTYGRTKGGGDFRAGSMWVDYFDPNTGLGLGVGISRSSGRGLYGFYPDDYGSPLGFGPGYFSGFGWPYYGGGFAPDEWYQYQGESRSFNASLDLNRFLNREFRRR